MNSIISRILGKKDDKAQLDSIRFHYERHLYRADKFKDIMRDLHTVALPEVVNVHDAIVGGAYFCTRDQLLAANNSRHCDWGPFPKSITGATFVVLPDCSIQVLFAQLYPVAPATPKPCEDFKATILGKGALIVLANNGSLKLSTLLSAARSEYLGSCDIAGHFMTKLTGLFGEIAEHAYGGRFVWSDYNLDQWDKFVASKSSSPEGGSCVFSCEADGNYSEASHNTFKSLFVGVPTGMHPYSISVSHGIAKMDTDTLHAWLTERGHRTV